MNQQARNFVGVGIYSPAEAARLTQVPAGKIARWLRGHTIGETRYEALWTPELDLGADGLFLGFRDLMEVRVAAAFIDRGLSSQRVRRAIELARELVGESHPLSTTRFRTDGASVFLQMAQEDGQTKLINLFTGQYNFREIVERSLKNIDFDDGTTPSRWWPLGKSRAIVVDPEIAFGQPIDSKTAVPVDALVAAVEAEGSVSAAARIWDVPISSINRAMRFSAEMARRNA